LFQHHVSSLTNRLFQTAAVGLFAYLISIGAVHAGVDLNGDGMSDIWQLIFHAQGVDPKADADGDGQTNLQESIAGTDPFNANSAFKVTKVDSAGGNITLHWPSVRGKRYQVYSSTNLTSWGAVGSVLAGTGNELTATLAKGSAPNFFRVNVSDVDTDGDGVNDWEEIQVGLDPNKTSTDGTNTDYNRVVAALQAASATLTVSEIDPVQTQDGMTPGTFTISRSGRLDPVTVTYNLNGTAVPGTDYQPLSGTATVPFGFGPAIVQVTAISGSTSTRTLTMNLNSAPPGSGYQLGTPSSATMLIPPQPGVTQVVQDIWTGIAGTQVSAIPLNTKPNSSRLLNSLENPSNAPLGRDYGTRIRGYFTAPSTGNYTFWIASDDQSELWISDDDQPASLTKRAWVTGATASREWTKYPEQKSRLLALTAGQKYYYEVYQKNGATPENLAVGWLKPGQGGTAPSEIIGATSNTLAPFLPIVHLPDGSTLYFANMAPTTGVTSTASGSATLQLAADETHAILNFDYTNLSSGFTAAHIHGPANPGQSGGILFDIDTAPQQQDGSYVWTFTQVGTYSPADLVGFIKAGSTYINVHTANYPSGEIRGQFARTSGAQAFVAPTPAPTVPPGPANTQDAARFLTQATFGPTNAMLTQVQSTGFASWLSQQFSTAATALLPRVDANVAALPAGTNPSNAQFQEAWWKNALSAPDYLRQRVAMALSEILVVSANGNSMGNNPEAMGTYWDLLATDAFGNFRQILDDITLNPAMGDFLDMVHNDKPDTTKGTEPNENYAREIMQLFSIGLNRLNPDGSLVLNNKNQPVPTYNQNVVIGYSHVFTGWYWSGATNWNYAPANYRSPMIPFAAHHDTTNTKLLLDNVILPAGQTQAQDLKDALDVIFNHPNVGPFVARQLIQRLVTDNPSPGYIYRVAQVFNNNGSGVRGDMKAVIQAILLDYEARTTTVLGAASYGHEREPLIRLTNLYRAFNASATSGNFVGGNQTANFAEAALYAPTVFNFFPPDYIQPGAIASAGLLAPEFAITTDTTVITSANKMRSATYQRPSGTNPDLLVLDLSSLSALSSNPGALVDSLNNLLMDGEMSSAMRNIVVNAVTQIPAANSLERAQTAVHLLVTSPEFIIEK
jgi:uncharacterized protein (DUF1800 family)